jgi:hypothetical protein
MTTFTQEIETEGRVPAIEYMATFVENTLTFHRSDGHEVGFALQHFDGTNQLHLAVMDTDLDNIEVLEEVTISYAEARVLKSFLCRPDISAILAQQ